MNVAELALWLSEFHDQEAEVQIVEHTSGTGYYDQGGNARACEFIPARHADYTDPRDNPLTVSNARTLLLGEISG